MPIAPEPITRTDFGIASGTYAWVTFALGDEREERDPAFINGIGTIGLIAQLSGMNMTPAFAPQRLARMPEATPEQRRDKLVRATRLLSLSAIRQRPSRFT